jgi:hypothetical protein
MVDICDDIFETLGHTKSHFVEHQESCRMDVERAIGVLQSRVAIVRCPPLTCSQDQVWEVVHFCVIMHNMVIESDRKTRANGYIGPYECHGPLVDVHQ